MAEAKQKWLADTKPEQGRLFADDTDPSAQKECSLDVIGIADETFWEQAEERIYAALQTYAEQAENGGGYQRRLFVDDVAHGFAFIDICRKRYDVVVMNPPFGEPTEATRQQLKERYLIAADNVAISFMLRGEQMLLPSGLTSSITDCSWAKKYDYREFRTEILKNRNLRVLVHLGWEVLDNANVETNLSVRGGRSELAFTLDVSNARVSKNGH